MNMKESEANEIKSKLILQELQRHEDLLKKARGKFSGFAFWSPFLAGTVFVIYGYLEVKTLPPGVVTLFTGLMLWIGASEARLHARVDAVLALISRLESKKENL